MTHPRGTEAGQHLVILNDLFAQLTSLLLGKGYKFSTVILNFFLFPCFILHGRNRLFLMTLQRKQKNKKSSIIDLHCWWQNKKVTFTDCFWGVFNWLSHYFLKHKGKFWEHSTLPFKTEVRSCVGLFSFSLVEKHSRKIFFQNICF